MITLPKSWSEVTLKTWQELNQIQSDSEITVLIERISILADCDPQEVRDLNMVKFKELTNQLEWLGKDLPKDINLTFEIDGKKYGMIPDLSFISTGEFVDIENWKDKSTENIHLISAVLWRPVIKENEDGSYLIAKHKSEGFMRRAELFREKLKITQIWGALLFFSTFGLSCLEIIQDYLTVDGVIPTEKNEETITKKKTRSRLKKSK